MFFAAEHFPTASNFVKNRKRPGRVLLTFFFKISLEG